MDVVKAIVPGCEQLVQQKLQHVQKQLRSSGKAVTGEADAHEVLRKVKELEKALSELSRGVARCEEAVKQAGQSSAGDGASDGLQQRVDELARRICRLVDMHGGAR